MAESSSTKLKHHYLGCSLSFLSCRLLGCLCYKLRLIDHVPLSGEVVMAAQQCMWLVCRATLSCFANCWRLAVTCAFTTAMAKRLQTGPCGRVTQSDVDGLWSSSTGHGRKLCVTPPQLHQLPSTSLSCQPDYASRMFSTYMCCCVVFVN